MIEVYENAIRKVILRKYPVLTDVIVQDQYEGIRLFSHFLGSHYNALFKTEECLSSEMQNQINKEVNFLIRYFPDQDNPFSEKKSVNCYFNCGEGYEYSGGKI